MRRQACTALLLLAASAHANGPQCWPASRYKPLPVPAAWAQAGTATIAALDPDNGPYFYSVSTFNSHYGAPAAYYVARKGHYGYLIYPLPDGGSLSAYVYVGQPPGDSIGAFVRRDRSCKFLGLIK